MHAIESYNKVREYPDDGGDYATLTISNHWNSKDKIVIQINDGKRYTFVADHIKRAVDNATHAHQY